MPQNARVIESDVYRDCTELRKVIFPPYSKMNKICTGAFAGSGLVTFTAPPALKVLESEVFMGCGCLTSVSLNEGLEKIGTRCFANTQITCIRIPRSVQEIAKGAFQGCTRLSYVIFEADPLLRDCAGTAFRGTAVRYLQLPNNLGAQRYGETSSSQQRGDSC